ncbi:MAG: glycoside hydrolase [Nocardioides sp.]|nr:glycoside hydrolase [Nocardioides sp.]
MTSSSLVLGPLLRHVDDTAASVWVEVAAPGTVSVRATAPDGTTYDASAGTFTAHGHHYALVCLSGLPPGTRLPYVVRVDDQQVWPEPGSDLPAPVVPTLEPGKPLRLAYGSCRTSVSHDADGNGTHGVDALRAYALRMAGLTHAGPDDPDDPDRDEPRWADLVLFLGDQVYADETTAAMQDFIEQRRGLDSEPGAELKDYEEYAHLYTLAWSDPVNRWLLSTLPSLMIFDDHDVRDDWNTSQAWKDAMEATSWWRMRILGGLASYWVYQHLGNLTPAERDADEVWARVQELAAAGEDAGPYLDGFAERADADPTAYRWSFARDLGPQARLVVVDSRAARVLDPARRSILDDDEMDWLDGQLRGDVDHLLIGTSLPFLLAPGLHYVEAFSEALAGGAWGPRAARVGERIRQGVDLEHWAAFQDGFQRVARMVLSVARGERGRAPATVTFLSGDVHHSYLSEAVASRRDRRAHGPIRSRVLQAVCSPIRNPLPIRMRYATAVASYGVAGPIGRVVGKSAKVPDAPMRWRLTRGPWFDNNLATLEVHGRGLRLWWATGEVEGDAHDRPRLVRVADVSL